MDNQNNDQSNLEYNDGLGDLLREKEKLEFSWTKTIIVLGAVIFVIFIGLTFLFNIGKNILTKDADPMAGDALTQLEEIDASAMEIEQENNKLIQIIDQDSKPTKKAKTVAKTKAKPKKVAKQSTKKSSSYSPFKVIAGAYKSLGTAKAF